MLKTEQNLEKEINTEDKTCKGFSCSESDPNFGSTPKLSCGFKPPRHIHLRIKIPRKQRGPINVYVLIFNREERGTSKDVYNIDPGRPVLSRFSG